MNQKHVYADLIARHSMNQNMKITRIRDS